MDRGVAKYISDLKSELMVKMPFWGDILSHVDVVENNSFETACTNGRVIYYNSSFMRSLSKGQRNYIIFHELFHIVLLHFKRQPNKEEEIWNVAADYVVNGMLDMLAKACANCDSGGVVFKRPPCGCFLDRYEDQSVEELYNMIYADNKKRKGDFRILLLRRRYNAIGEKPEKTQMSKGDFDLVIELTEEEERLLEDKINGIVDNAMKNWSKDPTSQLVKRQINVLKHDKRMPWKRILKRFLMESEGDETSYDHPERKYLHMEMILPGAGAESISSKLDNIWAFIDTSGSISEEEMNSFVSQLYQICRQFDSTMNIGFWDTSMHEVYTNVSDKDIAKCATGYSGGTDVNAVYDFLDKNKIDPRVMMILTDGCFDPPDPVRTRKLKGKTIMVLSYETSEDLGHMGRIARL